MPLWDGRFEISTNELLLAISESISYDQRLYAQDILGSMVHAEMLGRQGIIPQEEAEKIIEELHRIKQDIESGKIQFQKELEDIHMNIESELIRRLGDIGAKLHTARSRNDQIALDIRLYLRDEIHHIHNMLIELQKALVELADANADVIMPGFTHMQHAQPILFAHHLLAYVEMLERDKGRLMDTLKRMNVSPLGSGALAGSTFPIDRYFCAERLGFDDITHNSIDAVSDRDFIIELLACLSIIILHLSRFSEDLIFWKTQECDFIELGEAFCTGSSIMPQKKNPDIAELTRGKSGRVFGHLMALLTIMKGLPLSYNRDLQEDKEPLFDALDTIRLVLFAFVPMVRSITVKREKMLAAASDPNLMATDLAEWLVKQGVPFRTAHKRVGKLVAWCEKNHTSLNQLTLSQMQEFIPEATEECLTLFDPYKSVCARNIPGGTAPEQVEGRLAYWKTHLAGK